MTGYGKAVKTISNKTFSIEIRTLNSKTADLYTKIPNQYKELDLAIRQVLLDNLKRGKIDLIFTIDTNIVSTPAIINKALVQSYYEDLKATNDLIGQKEVDYLSLILRMPDIFTQADSTISEEEKVELIELVKEACNQVNTFRNQEGLALKKEFTNQLNTIRTCLENVNQHEDERIESVRQRMTKALEEIGTYDEVRFHQELIYYIEKLDVSEEKMRLANHLDYFLKTMQEEEDAGKKLGFIAQEIGREINTMGSKCNHGEIQKLVVNMKDSLEKIKEQVLNTL
jgi:uncharacterized protein (TIGR00255 family)